MVLLRLHGRGHGSAPPALTPSAQARARTPQARRGTVAALARHCLERYGEEEVSGWLWELWNEPDIYYWRGTRQEFNELYETTARAVRSVLPNASVGGPTVTGGPNGAGFLRDFLQFVADKDLPLDFVSFHTKGSRFVPWRTYGPIGSEAPEKQSPQTTKMLYEIRRLLRVMAEFPQFAKLPAIVDECDAGVPAHWGVYDNSNFRFQNTEYYPVFQANLMKKILDLNTAEPDDILDGGEVKGLLSDSADVSGEKKEESDSKAIGAGSGDVSSPVDDVQKKIRRAERFGVSVKLTEEEKRNSRAER